MERNLTVDGTTLFVDDRGVEGAPTLLFVHGGPGNSCWDFMASAADAFVREGFRVIGVDQRGVLRSGGIPDDAPLTVESLIADFEAVRRELDIDEWTIIGHSAGSGYACDYALARPESVAGVVFDAPCLDLDATDRYRLPIAAKMLDAEGKSAEADRCRALARTDRRLTVDDNSLEAMQALESRYLDLFFFGQAGRRAYIEVMESSPADVDWSRGMSHLPLLADMYIDRRDRIRDIGAPTLLVHGEADLVAAPPVIDAYRRAHIGDVATIPEAGHFAFNEQTSAYVDVVARFASTL